MMGFKKWLKGCVVVYLDESASSTTERHKTGTVVDRVDRYYLIADEECKIKFVKFSNIYSVVLETKFEKVKDE